MSKRQLTAVEQMAVEVREELLTVLIPCRAKGEPFHFSPRGAKVSPIAKAVGVTDPTIRTFASGGTVSVGTLAKIQAFLANRQESVESTPEPSV